MKPKFKETIPVFILDREVQIGEENGVAGFIDDPTGAVALLVTHMNGDYSTQQLIHIVQQTYPELIEQEILDAINTLAEAGYIENHECSTDLTAYAQERYKANINYFSLFTPYTANKFDFQKMINQVRVALLGVGGLGTQILYHLTALGFHQIKIMDFDKLELSNFNRQLLYAENDLGQLKTEMAKKRIQQFNPNVQLEVRNKKIASVKDVYDDVQDVEYVICVADRPTLHIQNWVNEAVVRADVPLISGGVMNTRGRFYTMIPDKTGCVACHQQTIIQQDQKTVSQLEVMHQMDFERKNAAISPNVAMLAGCIVNELVKIVTNISSPVALGKMMEIDYVTYQLTEVSNWSKQENCPICALRKMQI